MTRVSGVGRPPLAPTWRILTQSFRRLDVPCGTRAETDCIKSSLRLGYRYLGSTSVTVAALTPNQRLGQRTL